MGEVKRILFRKKYLLSVFLLVIGNLILFQYFQMDNLKVLNDEKSHAIITQKWKENQQNGKQELLQRVERMEKTANELEQVSIFANKESFSNKNIQRTKEDFKNIKDVNINTEDSDRAIVSFLEYDEIFYVGFLIVLLTILSFFDERKSGLWQMIYTCKKGRLTLAIKRLVALCISIFVFCSILIGTTLALSFYDYKGVGILFSSAQSVTSLQNFVVPISVLGFLLYFLLIFCLCLLASGLLIWSVLSIVHNRNIGMILLVVIYGIEEVLNIFLPEQHPLCVLKYINFVFFVNPKEIFIKYINFPVGIYLFNQRVNVEIAIAVLLIILMSIALVFNYYTRPFYIAGHLERITEKVVNWFRRGICHCSGIGYEWYKLLIQGKGIIILVIFIYLIIAGISKDDLLVSPGREQLNDFYAENTSEINADSMKAYQKIENELIQVNDNLEHADKKSKKAAQDIYQTYEATRSMFRKLTERLEDTKKLEIRGIAGWWLNESGYQKLFGKDNISKRMVNGIFGILVLILMLSSSFASERQSGISNIIRCTRKGRNIFFWRKMQCAIGTAIFVSIVSMGAELYEVGRLYPFRALTAPVQNLKMLENIPFTMSIGQFLAVWLILRMLVFVTVSVLCLMISSFCERAEKGQMLAMLLMVFTVISGGSEYMVLGKGRMIKTIMVTVFLIVGLLLGSYLTYQRWNYSKSRKRNSIQEFGRKIC